VWFQEDLVVLNVQIHPFKLDLSLVRDTYGWSYGFCYYDEVNNCYCGLIPPMIYG